MKTIIASTVIAVALIAAGQSIAANIALTDPSLENPFGGSQANVVSGWFTFGATSSAVNVSGGFWGDMTNRDGPNAAFAVQTGENDGGSIYQAVELDAGVTYTLSVAIGTSASVAKSDGKYALVFFNSNFSVLHAETTGTIAPQLGGFLVDDSVSFTPTTSGIYHVGMRNRGYVPGTGADNNESTIFFDNVRLIPEPSSALLAGFGLLALLRRRRAA